MNITEMIISRLTSFKVSIRHSNLQAIKFVWHSQSIFAFTILLLHCEGVITHVIILICRDRLFHSRRPDISNAINILATIRLAGSKDWSIMKSGAGSALLDIVFIKFKFKHASI